MHRDSGRLVEHEDPVVLLENRCRDRLEKLWADTLWLWLGFKANRGYPHRIAQLQAVLGACPSPIHAHLAPADDALDATARYAGQKLHQKTVEAAPSLLLGHLDVPDFDSFGPAGRVDRRAVHKGNLI
jgi:hypothetical protein